MQTLLRLLALVAIVLSIPACASTPKKSSCCSSHPGHSEKCAAGDASCKAPAAKKKAS